jgi:hypothetical protein
MNFNKNIDGFKSGDLFAICCEFEATIEYLKPTEELKSMTFDDMVRYMLSEEMYQEYVEETGSEETYENYKAIRQYVANDKSDYFKKLIQR